MLILTGSYPPIYPPIAAGAPAASAASISGVPAAVLEANATTEVAVAVAVPPPSGNAFFLMVPPALDLVTRVEVGGISYPFTYAGPQVVIYGPLPAGLSALLYGLPAALPAALATDEYLDDLPDWLKRYNAEGSFSITRSFGDQPSGDFTFVTLAQNESDIRRDLRVGTKLVYPALTLGFSVDSLTITRLPRTVYPDGLIRVQVALTGYWVKELERPIRAKADINASLTALTARAGVPFVGKAAPLNQASDLSGDSFTTLGQALEDYAPSVGGFPFYSSPEALGVRLWAKTPRHLIPSSEILGDIQIQIAGDGAAYDPFGGGGGSAEPQLTNEYRNTELGLEPDEAGSDYQRGTAYWLEESDDLLNVAPDSLTSDSLKTTSVCFTNGGPTKQKVRTLYQNGSIQKQIRQVWGLAYKSTQVHIRGLLNFEPAWEYVPTNPSSFWRICEESTETYTYNAEGYLVAVEKQGRRLAQYKQEQNNEALIAELVPTVVENGRVTLDGDKLRALYDFIWLPYTDRTIYRLASLVGVYPDIVPSDAEDWIPPRYCVLMERKSFEQIVTDNPESDTASGTQLPPVVTGKSFQEVTITRITYPNAQTDERSYNSGYDQYMTSTGTQNSEGAQMVNALRISRRTEQAGRPSVHTRMQRTPRFQGPPRPARAGTQQYLLNTPGSGALPNDPPLSYISFAGVTEPETGRFAAEIASSIANTFGSESWALPVSYRTAKQICEGDRIVVQGQELIVRTLTVTLNLMAGQTTATAALEAGNYLAPPVSLTVRTIAPSP